MATETMNSDNAWPAVGNPPPPMDEDAPNPEWEMIAETEEKSNAENNRNVVIFPGASATETVRLSGTNSGGMIKGRPRSATIGAEREATATGTAVDDVVTMPRNNSNCEIQLPSGSSHSSHSRRLKTLRRCASTPDLLMSDNAHEVIVEDESDDYESEELSSEGEDAELVEAEEGYSDGESFEVLSSEKQEAGAEGDDEEPVMIMDEDNDGEEESATLVSTPSVGTSSWTMASTPSTSVWGMKKSPSFAEILSKNVDENTGVFGKDKAHTEAQLRDSHRRHHLRVRTKPKFIIASDTDSGDKRGMMKHAHSTGDLSNMLNPKGEGHCNSPSRRRVKKQLSAMMEEDGEEGDFVIGRGSGTNSGGCGGGGGGGFGGVDVLGDTDATDYYQRKEHGLKSTSNKKKERPDEAKRREIIMHKKEMQRKKQAESQKGGGGGSTTEEAGGSGKKKKNQKNDKGFGGKKERRQR